MAASKKIVLVTGGNSGIGFETCAQLLASGDYHVLLASRSLDKGKEAVKTLESRNLPGTVEVIELDVTNDDAITAAAGKVESQYGSLHILINNAGLAGPQAPLRESMQAAFNANATGVAVVTEVFAPLLKKATTQGSPARIINVGTGGGSVAMRLDPNAVGADIKHIPYRTSKCALNMVTACQVAEYGGKGGVKVFLYCPGFTASNLSPYNKVEMGARPVDEAVRPLMEIVEGKRDGDAGKYLHSERDGAGIYPW